MDKEIFIELALKGPVSIDQFSTYKVIKINDSEIEMSLKFKKQLKKEGLYNNSYIGISVLAGTEECSIQMEMLPIYGLKKKYITKHFSSTKEEAINLDLDCKDLNLLENARIFSLQKDKCMLQ